METLEFRPSRLKSVGMVFLACAMVALSWFSTTADSLFIVIAGWVGVAFFGLGLVLIVRRFFRASKPEIILTPTGIEDDQTGFGFIPWTDIEDMSVHIVSGQKLLSLRLSDPEPYLSRISAKGRSLSSMNQSMGFGHVCLAFSHFDHSMEEAMTYIEKRGCLPSSSRESLRKTS